MSETRLPDPPTARMTDAVRIELLENAARTPGGIRLSADDRAIDDYLSLGLHGRTLRDAIDTAFGAKPVATLGAPHLVVTRKALVAAVANFVLAAKAGKITPEPRTLQGGQEVEILLLEQVALSWAASIWSFLGGE